MVQSHPIRAWRNAHRSARAVSRGRDNPAIWRGPSRRGRGRNGGRPRSDALPGWLVAKAAPETARLPAQPFARRRRRRGRPRTGPRGTACACSARDAAQSSAVSAAPMRRRPTSMRGAARLPNQCAWRSPQRSWRRSSARAGPYLWPGPGARSPGGNSASARAARPSL